MIGGKWRHLIPRQFHTSWRAVFEFVVIALVFMTAEPTPVSFGLGSCISLMGEGLRLWTIGYKRRANHFFIVGPYRFVRHPFYLGTFLLILGLTIMGGNAFLAGGYLVGACFLLLHNRQQEERRLRRLAGPEFAAYQTQVSAFIPQLVPVPKMGADDLSFTWQASLFRGGRREIDSVLGLLGGFGLMYVCMILPERQWFHIAIGIFLLLFVIARTSYYVLAARLR